MYVKHVPTKIQKYVFLAITYFKKTTRNGKRKKWREPSTVGLFFGVQTPSPQHVVCKHIINVLIAVYATISDTEKCQNRKYFNQATHIHKTHKLYPDIRC